MRKIVSTISLIFTGMLLFSGKTYASHAMGAGLSYVHYGGLTYGFTFTLYRDCAGIMGANTMEVHAYSSCDSDSTVFTVYMQSITEIPHACPDDTSTCNGGTVPGIQEYIYTGTGTLPAACADWEFRLFDIIEQEYGLCCRNYGITNLQPFVTNLYLEATLDNIADSVNSSPVFSNGPIIFLCNQVQQFYNPGAVDPDGDSLTYELITPQSGPDTNVIYLTSFSAQQPISYLAPTTLDSLTGMLSLYPDGVQSSVLAIQINEFRNGILIGSSQRDFQIIVEPCANTLPMLTGMNGTTQFADTVEAGSTICFTVFSSDADSSDSLSLSWDQGIPGGTFTISSGQAPQGDFCWIPSAADTSLTPYSFTVTVTDDHCPVIGSNVFAFSVLVIPSVSTGIGENTAVSVAVYPNPSSGVFCFASRQEIEDLHVYDQFGKLIMEKPGIVREIDLSYEKTGIYQVLFKTHHGIIPVRLIRK